MSLNFNLNNFVVLIFWNKVKISDIIISEITNSHFSCIFFYEFIIVFNTKDQREYQYQLKSNIYFMLNYKNSNKYFFIEK